jgi:hypothetical protein
MTTLRHASALVLVGWYLMLPPVNPNNLSVDSDAPIAQWEIGNSFDSASQCDALRLQVRAASNSRARYDDAKSQQHPPLSYSEWQKRLKAAVCIATDDPRLKGN